MPIIDLSTGELTDEQPIQPEQGQQATVEPTSGGIIDLNTLKIISNETGSAFIGAGATFGFKYA